MIETGRIMALSMATGCAWVLTAAAPPEPSVCERLAPQLGLKHVWLSGPGGAIEEWRRETATLFSGAATRIRVSPLDPATASAEDYRRLEKACDTSRSGAECTVAGPAQVQLNTRRGDAVVTVQSGERAIIGVRSSRVFCRRG